MKMEKAGKLSETWNIESVSFGRRMIIEARRTAGSSKSQRILESRKEAAHGCLLVDIFQLHFRSFHASGWFDTTASSHLQSLESVKIATFLTNHIDVSISQGLCQSSIRVAQLCQH